MNNTVIIVPSEPEDVFELKDNLRAEDIEECQACGHTPAYALSESYALSDECYSAKVDNKTVAMFGVSSHQQPEGFGVIWYLGSDESFNHPITLVKGGRKYVKQWLEKYKVLYNAVDTRNTRHIAWLEHIGFKFIEPTYVNGFEFLQFYQTKE
jgi:hypothetical protein